MTDDAVKTRTAVAGFLAGYCGTTRRSYTTDLRIFAGWCAEANLELFEIRGPMWSCSAGGWRRTRRLSTLASFYRYCEQEGLIERNPAANVRRPKIDYESRTLGLAATSWAPSWSRLGWLGPRPRPSHASRI